jgi:tRNA threonylcarbamoyladenosine biosynthesis protein TsaE
MIHRFLFCKLNAKLQLHNMMREKIIATEGPDETQHFAEEFLQELVEQSRGSVTACVVGLLGDLGGGKTTFTQGLAKALGIEDPVRSPTFLIMKTFDLPRPIGSFERCIHIDAYRLEKEEEMEQLGWQELINDPNNLIIVEWADKITALLPENTIKLEFEFIDEQTRKITIHGEK